MNEQQIKKRGRKPKYTIEEIKKMQEANKKIEISAEEKIKMQKEKNKQNYKKYYEANKEKEMKRNLKYIREHKEIINERNRINYYIRKLNNIPEASVKLESEQQTIKA